MCHPCGSVLNKAIVKSLLDWNPWIEGHSLEEIVGHQRQIDVTSYLAVPEIKILTGVRRSGKSRLLYQVIKELLRQNRRLLYVNFQDELLRRSPLSEIYYTWLQRGPIDCLLIDEVQYCPNWAEFIRTIYDRKEIDQIWLSGSNASLLQQDYAELFTGRNMTLKISTLSFREFLSFRGIQPSDCHALSSAMTAKIKAHFMSYLNYGAFPALAARTAYQKELLINYYEDFIYKDISSRHAVNNAKLNDLGIYLASNASKEFSNRKIAAALNLHPHTIAEYLNCFKDVYLFDDLCGFDYSLKRQLASAKKIYAVDTGLAAAVAFKFYDDLGRMLENCVYNELKRTCKSIYFHKAQKECDFIVVNGFAVSAAIQVCVDVSDADTRTREISGLVEAMQMYKLTSGTILTLDTEDNQSITVAGKRFDIQFIPVWQWLITARQL